MVRRYGCMAVLQVSTTAVRWTAVPVPSFLLANVTSPLTKRFVDLLERALWPADPSLAGTQASRASIAARLPLSELGFSLCRSS